MRRFVLWAVLLTSLMNFTSPVASLALPRSTKIGTFYLTMQEGCYAATRDPLRKVAFSALGKTFYRRSCSTTHHLQVFRAGDVDGYNATHNLNQQSAEAICNREYETYLGYSGAEGDASSPGLVWFYPDDGAEARRYPGRLVCAFAQLTSDNKLKVWKSEY